MNITNEMIAAAELKLAEVLSMWHYEMPRDGMEQVISASLQSAAETPAPQKHTDWQAVAEHYRLAMLEVERRISSQPVREMLPGQSINETAKFISDLSQVLWEARQKVIFKEPLAAPAPETKAMQISAADDPDRPWEPWTVMHVGDQRNIIREVLSEDGQTALAYFTGKFMALAPISENPEPLPFKVWRQRRTPSSETNEQIRAALAVCPTCNDTGKEGRHSICRDCDENPSPAPKSREAPLPPSKVREE